MYKANVINYKALIQETKYISDKKYYYYHMKTYININIPWELRVYSVVDYTGDNYTRKSVTGYIVIINGSVIAWNSKIQKTVTLSVTKAEY